jgi:hypothetical protein
MWFELFVFRKSIRGCGMSPAAPMAGDGRGQGEGAGERRAPPPAAIGWPVVSQHAKSAASGYFGEYKVWHRNAVGRSAAASPLTRYKESVRSKSNLSSRCFALLRHSADTSPSSQTRSLDAAGSNTVRCSKGFDNISTVSSQHQVQVTPFVRTQPFLFPLLTLG